MGFERLVRVLQNKTSNYDTDVFTGTIAEIEKIAGRKYDFSDSKQAVAFRVLSDHIRAISFTIADGQLPSNTGAGYVIRRILRRAVRYYYSYLDYKQPLLHQLVAVIATQFEKVFPELKQQEAFVTKVIKEEEDSFLRTLGKGIDRFSEYINVSQKQRDKNVEKVWVAGGESDIPIEPAENGKLQFAEKDFYEPIQKM
nr:alanine--tRNA ligase-related protein [Niabella ginsengisoli]